MTIRERLQAAAERRDQLPRRARPIVTRPLYGPTTHEDTDVRPVSPDDDTKAARGE